MLNLFFSSQSHSQHKQTLKLLGEGNVALTELPEVLSYEDEKLFVDLILTAQTPNG